ncbi:YceD family protein [Parapedobacter deserti]|uniref:YceD family protein n=1 Tax=Parapedobacter deserti TaxID=1912957 RepID=A0ABV7JPD6_9SPHI
MVNYLKQYRVPFTGLSIGKHDFEFTIDKAFFDCYEYSIVKDGTLKAAVSLQKQENMMVLKFHITGTIALTCDVCLSAFPSKTDIEERLIVKFMDEDMVESTEEILVLAKHEHELDLANLLYEYINVSVPYYARCNKQGENISCDSAVVAKLNELAPEQGDGEKEEEKKEEQTDPRWDALKNIKYNKN